MRDPTQPLFHWYVDSVVGKELVFALYTLPCRYARCTFCSLPVLSEGGAAVTPQNLERQVDYVLAQYSDADLQQVAKVSVYTAASALDQECLPTRSLMYLMLRVCDLPQLQVVSLETRPEYVEDWEFQALQAILGERVGLEIGIGYETHDPHLRNHVLGKGLSAKAIHRLMRQLAAHHAALKAYVMLKPHHSLTEEQGIAEAIDGLDELAGLAREYGVPVSVHLNPTYIAEGCRLTEELIAHNYEPPELTSILEVVHAATLRALPIYVGLDDEGLAVEGGTFRATDVERKATVAALLDFNRHQDGGRLLAEAGYRPRA